VPLNVGTLLPDYTALQIRKQPSSFRFRYAFLFSTESQPTRRIKNYTRVSALPRVVFASTTRGQLHVAIQND
jgi:hypothetical protein